MHLLKPRLRRPQTNQRISSAILPVLFLASFINAAEIHVDHVRNFGQVSDSLYRGGMPTDEALRELKDLGVNTVLDLREDGPAREQEKQRVQQFGMHYEHVPLPRMSAPTQAEIQEALSLILRNPKAKIYVHCLRGKDRTGTVIACYRIQHDGWQNARALAEAKQYGMSRLERAMQAYIMHFTPFTLPSPVLPGN